MANILLAGGTEIGRREMSRMLACYGHFVRSVEDGPAAARAHRRQPAQLLILDLSDAQGADAVEAFRREDDELPVLALTCDARGAAFVDVLDAGADAALPRAASRVRLLDTVDRLVACFAAEASVDEMRAAA